MSVPSDLGRCPRNRSRGSGPAVQRWGGCLWSVHGASSHRQDLRILSDERPSARGQRVGGQPVQIHGAGVCSVAVSVSIGGTQRSTPVRTLGLQTENEARASRASSGPRGFGLAPAGAKGMGGSTWPARPGRRGYLLSQVYLLGMKSSHAAKSPTLCLLVVFFFLRRRQDRTALRN